MTVSPFDILLESFLLSIFAASKRDYKIFSFAACSSPKSKSPVLAHVLHSPLKKMTMEHLEGQSVCAPVASKWQPPFEIKVYANFFL